MPCTNTYRGKPSRNRGNLAGSLAVLNETGALRRATCKEDRLG